MFPGTVPSENSLSTGCHVLKTSEEETPEKLRSLFIKVIGSVSINNMKYDFMFVLPQLRLLPGFGKLKSSVEQWKFQTILTHFMEHSNTQGVN